MNIKLNNGKVVNLETIYDTINKSPLTEKKGDFLSSLNEGKKRYYQQDRVGSAKYTISYHDGKKKHKDGSDFFDIKTFRNKKDLAKFVNTLHKSGYVYGFNESVNEGTKVYSMDVDDMVDVLSGWEKGVGGYSDGNAVMGKKLHGKKPEPFYNYAAGMHVSGGLKDALKALTKMWKKLDVKPSTTTKIFKAYHKLPDSKKKFSNPSFWEKFLEKNGISVVAESVNEGSISPTQAGKLFDKLLKKQTKGNLPSTKDIEIVFSLLRKKYGIKGESVNEGKYHTWRNDESLTPKQKIGRSMREIRDHLTEIDKLTKMNVRLKREMGVDSRDYWKNTHKALSKISERLVKLAKRVGEIY